MIQTCMYVCSRCLNLNHYLLIKLIFSHVKHWHINNYFSVVHTVAAHIKFLYKKCIKSFLCMCVCVCIIKVNKSNNENIIEINAAIHSNLNLNDAMRKFQCQCCVVLLTKYCNKKFYTCVFIFI